MNLKLYSSSSIISENEFILIIDLLQIKYLTLESYQYQPNTKTDVNCLSKPITQVPWVNLYVHHITTKWRQWYFDMWHHPWLRWRRRRHSRRHLTAKCYRICMQHRTHWQCSILSWISSWSAVRCHENHHTPHPAWCPFERATWLRWSSQRRYVPARAVFKMLPTISLVPVGAIEGLPSLWSATAGRLCVPATITLTIGPWTSAVFWVFSPTAWNYLPVDLWVFLLSSYFREKLKLYSFTMSTAHWSFKCPTLPNFGK